MWIARDGERDGGNDGLLTLFYFRPPTYENGEWYDLGYKRIEANKYPEVKNGECYELILGEKVEPFGEETE